MLTIWGRANSSNVQKVIWACDELAMPFERIDLGGPFGGNDAPAYRAMNPNGRVPTIDHDGFVLWESNAILRYLAAINPERRLVPAGPHALALLDQWLDWQMATLGLALRGLLMLVLRPEATAPAGAVAAAAAEVGRHFETLDHHLDARRYLVGDQFSIADIALGISAHRWLNLPIQRPVLPALAAWYAAIAERPGFARIRAIPLS